MSYVSVQAPQLDRPLRVPEDKEDDEVWREAAEELLEAALQEQARALSAHRDGRALEALRHAEASARLFPYSPDVLEGALLITLQYGDVEPALALLHQAEKLGCERIAKTYRSTVEHAAERWNHFLRDPDALANVHHSEEGTLALRELLLLAHHDADELSPADRGRLSTAGFQKKRDVPLADRPPRSRGGQLQTANTEVARQPWRNVWLVAMAAGVVGILLGLAVPSVINGEGSTVESGGASREVLTRNAENAERRQLDERRRRLEASVQNVKRFAKANANLTGGRFLEALRTLAAVQLDSAISARDTAQLRARIRGELLRQGERAWYGRDFERVVKAMQPAMEGAAGSPTDTEDRAEQHYRVGFAAYRTGRDSLAKVHLGQALKQSTERRYFEAEAAHSLAMLLTPGRARRYARLISKRYPGTVYDDAAIQRLLNP